MPPCSAIARRRLSTRHTVIHGPNHMNTYSSGRPYAVAMAINTIWAPKMRSAIGRLDR